MAKSMEMYLNISVKVLLVKKNTKYKFSPVKSSLAFGVVGHGNGVTGYDRASTLPNTVMERRGVIWPGGRDWRETSSREKD